MDKAPTDERSDIYSLAMSLFHLLTYTLSETGFGLKNVRAVNPQISPAVAQALEKATALDPDERYENVAEFRRALLGVGTFIFENGDLAVTSEELTDLCARYPEEASGYLAAGEVELWLHEIGEEDLSRAARRTRMMGLDPQEAVEHFIRTVTGQSIPLRSSKPNDSHPTPTSTTPPTPPRNSRNWLSWLHRPPPPIRVSPRTLDFGSVSAGISAPLVLVISSEQGSAMSGTIQPTEPWILVDTTQLKNSMTRVNVRVNTTNLRSSTHYTGSIIIAPQRESEIWWYRTLTTRQCT